MVITPTVNVLAVHRNVTLLESCTLNIAQLLNRRMANSNVWHALNA
jgi:hypothetical protein